MTFPHTHKKKPVRRLEVFQRVRDNNLEVECFVFSAKIILQGHTPKNRSQVSTNKLLKRAIVNYYNQLPEDRKHPNPLSREFKEWCINAYLEQVRSACVLLKPKIHDRMEQQIALLVYDCVRQIDYNRRFRRR